MTFPQFTYTGMALNNFPFCFTQCENCHKLDITIICANGTSFNIFLWLSQYYIWFWKDMSSLILFTLIRAGSSPTGSIVDSVVGIASSKNLVWQNDPMVYWALTVLEWNSWFKEEKVLQLQLTISFSLLIFP